MRTLIPFAMAAALFSTTALAQTTTTPSTTPAPAAPSATTPSATPSVPEQSGAAMTMTDQQASAWVNKTVYSSDGKNVGEVAAIQRDSSGKVTELFADIGGFLGLGESRVRVMPSQFKIDNDRITLNMTGEQAKTLPKVEK